MQVEFRRFFGLFTISDQIHGLKLCSCQVQTFTLGRGSGSLQMGFSQEELQGENIQGRNAQPWLG